MDKEALKTDSTVSSMRIMFARTVNTALFISVLGIGGSIVAALLDKKFDLIAASALVGVLLTTAYGGKSAQSFAEREQTK